MIKTTIGNNQVIVTIPPTPQIRVILGTNYMLRYLQKEFYFIATEGQTEFLLEYTPRTDGIFVLFVGGVGQSKTKGDYSVSGSTIIMAEGLDAGDEVSGLYEISQVGES